MKTNEVKDVLMKALYDSKSLITDNFMGCGLSECDVLRITGSNLTYEYEIKVSRSDFKAELKNKTKKHAVLRGKHKTDPHGWKYSGEVLQERWGSVGRTNFFYFVTPKDLIKLEEIPDFSGLIYVDELGYQIIKKAPKLHSFKATNKLIRKVCSALTAKNIFGSSYITYRNKESEKIIQEHEQRKPPSSGRGFIISYKESLISFLKNYQLVRYKAIHPKSGPSGMLLL